jgi:hypothetical protein
MHRRLKAAGGVVQQALRSRAKKKAFEMQSHLLAMKPKLLNKVLTV